MIKIGNVTTDLRETRKLRKQSRREASRASGISERTFARIEKGEANGLNATTLERVIRYTGKERDSYIFKHRR